MFGWISRRPKLAFWLTTGVCLFVGLVVGIAAGSQQAEVDKQTKRADAAEADLASVSEKLDATEGRLGDAESQTAALEERIETLTAKGEVPDFTGRQISTARDEDAVEEYNWNLKTVQRITTDESPGTVIAQSPPEGTVLKSGRSLTLTIAKEPPPQPPEWVTIQTLSGASSTKTDEFRVPYGSKARLVYSMPQDGNNAITLYRPPARYVDLVLNEIGPQSGSTRLYPRAGSTSTSWARTPSRCRCSSVRSEPGTPERRRAAPAGFSSRSVTSWRDGPPTTFSRRGSALCLTKTTVTRADCRSARRSAPRRPSRHRFPDPIRSCR